MVGAYANAVQDAAKNENGAMNGFMGVGMMNMASGGAIGGMVNNAGNNTAGATTNIDPYAKSEGVKCPNCGTPSNGNFCGNCGTKIERSPKKCAKCGTEVTGKFCSNCGEKQE